jgi:hypothetical protein
VFRTSDAQLVGNYRVPAELSAIESTADGKSIVLGTLDGCVTVLAIADPAREGIRDYLASLPSRNADKAGRHRSCPPFYFRTAAKMAALAARVKSNLQNADASKDTSMAESASVGQTISTEASTIKEE